jgi:hypothetical protein
MTRCAPTVALRGGRGVRCARAVLLALETSPRLAPLFAEQLPAWGFPAPRVVCDYAGAMRVVWAIRASRRGSGLSQVWRYALRLIRASALSTDFGEQPIPLAISR